MSSCNYNSLKEMVNGEFLRMELDNYVIKQNKNSLITTTHPAVLIQHLTKHVFRPAAPVEFYSQDRPLLPPNFDEGLVPIDILLGRYFPSDMRIEIYIRNIEHYAKSTFNCEVNNLEHIVRLHEYAHALVHIGITHEKDYEILSDVQKTGKTEWASFLQEWTGEYNTFDKYVHEQLAQLITLLLVRNLEPIGTAQRLEGLFVTLMEKQPNEYILNENMLKKATTAGLTRALIWLRNRQNSTIPDDVPLMGILETIILQEKNDTVFLNINKSDAEYLQEKLAEADFHDQVSSSSPELTHLLIKQFDVLKVKINPEYNIHQRPHFHIEYKTEYSASYAINNFERLAGNLPRKYERIVLDWARSKQRHLIDMWNQLKNSTSSLELIAEKKI